VIDVVKLERSPAQIAALPYQTGGDLCLGFWALAVDQGWIAFPPDAQVLEIGCAEADWQTPMLALRPDLQITGVDWRACERPGRTIHGDVLAPQLFQPATFDAVVSISAIEHVGLGAYEDDPLDRNGDCHAMRNAHRWLKPGGWLYLDVPHGPTYAVEGAYRRYNDAAVQMRLLPGFAVRAWAHCEVNHPDSPYLALLLDKL
jgi:cyclopropane fatty-acyl-phospholipid synthase-like methyltransferase